MIKLYAVLKLMFISSVLLSFNSCEWDGNDDNNYVDIDKPSETINLKVDLSGVNPNQVIQIANGSYISYTLSSEGKRLINQKFYLDGKELASWNSNITINESTIDNEIHDLKLVMTFKTGTGSLADLAGVEYYVGEFDFKIKIRERYNNSELNIRQTLDNGTYLKLEWDKPQNIDIGRYEVYEGWLSLDTPIAVINNPDETYFVDKTYSYGYKSFRVKAIPANSINITDTEGSVSVNSIAFTQDNIKASITDTKVTVSWENPNPYPAKYVVYLSDYNDVKEVKDGENSVEFDRPPFPFASQWAYSSIYILPLDANIEDYKSYPYTYFFFSDKNLSNYTYSLQLWNKKTNSLIGFNENQFFSHNILDKGALNNRGTLPFDIYKGFERDYYSLNYNGLIAIEGYKNNERNIYVFEGKNFPEEIYTFNNLAPTSFTISDKYLFYLDESRENICVVDFVTKQVVAKKNVSEKTYYNTVLDISSDGRYIVLYTPQLSGSVTNYTIYEFKDNEIKELRYVEMQIANILFNPQDPSQIIIHDYFNQFHIIDVASGNTLQTVTNNMYLFADPYTGNILCYSYAKDGESKYLSVYDNTLTKVLYKVEASTFPQHQSQFVLVNNLIFTSGVYGGNYVLDISESLKNK